MNHRCLISKIVPYHEYNQERFKKSAQKKLNAEKLIVHNLVFSDTKDYCDTFAVSEDFVKDHQDFFKIF